MASRNILVSSINQVKLSDFGMTQKLKPNEIYQQDPNTKIPYRWHPLESLESNIFISKSDVTIILIIIFVKISDYIFHK